MKHALLLLLICVVATLLIYKYNEEIREIYRENVPWAEEVELP